MSRRIGQKKSPELMSRVVSGRLNPEYSEDKIALEQWDYALSQGKTPRQVITDALMRSAGIVPEMYHRPEDDMATQLSQIKAQLNALYGMVENGVMDMLRNIKAVDPQGFREFANAESGELEISEQFAKNAQKAARKTFRQRGES